MDGACVDVQVMIFIVEIADDLLEPRWWWVGLEVVGHVACVDVEVHKL